MKRKRRGRVETPKVPPAPSRNAHFVGWASAVVAAIGLVAGWPGLVQVYLSLTEPRVELRWFDLSDGRTVVCPAGVATTPPVISVSDMNLRRVRLPIQLAIQNRDGRRLSNVRATFRFDSDAFVASSAVEVVPLAGN